VLNSVAMSWFNTSGSELMWLRIICTVGLSRFWFRNMYVARWSTVLAQREHTVRSIECAYESVCIASRNKHGVR
jgi:hypothetical protein